MLNLNSLLLYKLKIIPVQVSVTEPAEIATLDKVTVNTLEANDDEQDLQYLQEL